MKFGQYLTNQQIPEWRRAYINYQGLKKLIKRVNAHYQARISLQLDQTATRSSSVYDRTVGGLRRRATAVRTPAASQPNTPANEAPAAIPPVVGDIPPVDLKGTGLRLGVAEGYDAYHHPWSEESLPRGHGDDGDDGDESRDVHDSHAKSVHGTPRHDALRLDLEAQPQRPAPTQPPTHVKRHHVHMAADASAVRTSSSLDAHTPRRDGPTAADDEQGTAGGDYGDDAEADTDHSAKDSHGGSSQRPMLRRSGHSNRSSRWRRARDARLDNAAAASPLDELTALIRQNFDDEEAKFFSALDVELDKVVEFCEAREAEAAKRFDLLAGQLRELTEHRRLFKARHPHVSASKGPITLQLRGAALSRIESIVVGSKRGSVSGASNHAAAAATGGNQSLDAPGGGGATGGGGLAAGLGVDETEDEGHLRRAQALARMLELSHGGGGAAHGGHLSAHEAEEDFREREALRDAAQSRDPERYRQARKKLKLAVLEYYRLLELIKNYRTLNRTGMAKAMKKFEKATGVRGVSDAYYRARLERTPLVTSHRVDELLHATEEVFTAYFEHGNRKKAVHRLREQTGPAAGSLKTHHFSASRTGFYLGIAVVGAVCGVIEGTQLATRVSVPRWDTLLRVYGGLFLATLLALLFGTNLWVFRGARVNTLFIFEWDVRSAMAYQQYFELPSFLMLLLMLAFWVSLLNPSWNHVASTTYPVMWLGFVGAVLVSPLPFFQRASRKWFVKSILRLFTGGALASVEFRDFFLGDCLTSLAWPLSNFYVIGCEYRYSWREPGRCDPNRSFWTPVLLSLPALLRATQCLRRYFDSGRTAKVQLVNMGKYVTIYAYYWIYFNWRYHGSVVRSSSGAAWITFGCLYSLYAGSWDLLLDWNLLRPHARRFLLRDELLYDTVWPVYYWAMFSNTIMRFQWVIYLLPGPASQLTRVFLVALIEVLRRWQWISFRVETEQVGNIDSYRVVRDVPFPYRLENSDDEDDEASPRSSQSGRRRKRESEDGGEDDGSQGRGGSGGGGLAAIPMRLREMLAKRRGSGQVDEEDVESSEDLHDSAAGASAAAHGRRFGERGGLAPSARMPSRRTSGEGLLGRGDQAGSLSGSDHEGGRAGVEATRKVVATRDGRLVAVPPPPAPPSQHPQAAADGDAEIGGAPSPSVTAATVAAALGADAHLARRDYAPRAAEIAEALERAKADRRAATAAAAAASSVAEDTEAEARAEAVAEAEAEAEAVHLQEEKGASTTAATGAGAAEGRGGKVAADGASLPTSSASASSGEVETRDVVGEAERRAQASTKP